MENRSWRLVGLLSVAVVAMQVSLAVAAPSKNASKKKKATAVSKAQSKKKTPIGEMLRGLKGAKDRGERAQINKTFTALPTTAPTRSTPKPVTEVKPPRSSDLFGGGENTDEEALEHMTDQSIQELYKLTRQYKNSKNRGELWLRLAEAYVEKSKFIEYRVQKDYDEKLRKHLDGRGPKPRLDLSKSREYNVKSIKLYEWFLNDFPKDPKVDQALFFLGYNYIELDQVKKGVTYYTRLTKEHPNSPYVSEAQFALGEYYFDNNKWREAEKNYSDVLRNRRARLYTFALYKIAWCQYRQGRVSEGLRTLEKVVHLSRGQDTAGTPGGRKAVSRIRLASEALKDIVLFYGDVGNYKMAREYFNSVGGEKAVLPMLEKLAYYYSDSGKREPAMHIFKQLLETNRTAPKAFDYQYQIVTNFATSSDQRTYRQELFLWVDNYKPDSEWGQANRSNPKLIEDSNSLRESTLRNYVLTLHKNAQNSGKKQEMLIAKDGYERYLKAFPSVPKSVEMHFFYAELLYGMGQYIAAGREYQYVADADQKSPYHEQAVLNTLLALEKGLKSDQEVKKIVGDSLNLVSFGEAENAFVRAADRYTQSFPKGTKNVDVRFKVGRLHYSFNHFDEALAAFKGLIQTYPRTPYAVYSANLILDIYNLRKDYDAIAREGSNMMRNRALTEQGFETDIKDLVEKASFKKASDKEVAKDYEGSAHAFADFLRLYPKSQLATAAAFNAAVNFERAKKTSDAIAMYKRVEAASNNKKDQKLHNKSMLLLGRLYEQTAQYEKAALEFEKYTAANPRDPLAPDLYFNAAVIWEGQRSNNRAVKNYEEYQHLSKRKDRNSVFFTIAQIYEQQGSISKAKEYYEKYLSANPNDGEKVLESLFKLGGIAEAKHKASEAEKIYRRTVATHKSYQEKGQNVGARWAAEAKFKLINRLYNDFVFIRIPANPKKQAEAVQQKLALLSRLATQLADVIKYDDGNMVIASLTKLGQAYEHLKNSILKAPVPSDLTGKDLQDYKAGVEGLAKKQEEEALTNYKAAVAKSYEINFYSDWTNISLKALERLDPTGHPSLKEMILPAWSADEMGLGAS